MHPRTLAYFPHTFMGHKAEKSRGKVRQYLAVACGLHALLYCSILFWAMWPKTVRENYGKYANAWGLHATLHILMCFTGDYSILFYAMFHFSWRHRGPE